VYSFYWNSISQLQSVTTRKVLVRVHIYQGFFYRIVF